MLSVSSVTKKFGGLVALNNVDLKVEQGEIRGLIGPNGSGKTTLFNVITCYEQATSGSVSFRGRDVTGCAPYQISRAGVARTFQHIELFKGMTVLDNVLTAAQCHSKARLGGVTFGFPLVRREDARLKDIALQQLEFVGIAQYKEEPAHSLAYGLQRRLEIARALATQPALLLLDEPAAGMNPTEKQQLIQLIKRISESGITVIIIEHDMRVVSDLVDRTTVLDSGVKICEGTPAEVQNDAAVIAAYLGKDDLATKPTGAVSIAGVVGDSKGPFSPPPQPRTCALALKLINSFYGNVRVLKDISFSLQEGEFVALIGANGAGKTTLLKTISGMLAPRSGHVTYLGEEIAGMRSDRIVARGLVYVPEGRGIFPALTVLENLMMGAFLRKNRTEINHELEKVFTIFPRLKERIRQAGGSLSGGEQQMLAIGRAVMSKPKVLLLDEPSMGLSPKLVVEVLSTVKSLHGAGQTILLVEQNAKAALSVAERGFVLEVGQLVLEGAAGEVLSDPSVKTAYLGG
jgi:ABC-type branched-subunit amino acid transport system ATPase component